MSGALRPCCEPIIALLKPINPKLTAVGKDFNLITLLHDKRKDTFPVLLQMADQHA